MKDFRFSIALALWLFLAGAMAGSADSWAAENKPFILRISHSTSPEDFMYKGYEQLIQKLESRSNGRIKCEHYHSSALTVDRTAMEFVRDDSVQLGSAPASIVAVVANDFRWNIYTQPFFAEGSSEKLYRVADGKVGQMLNRDLEKKFGYKIFGMYGLGWSDIGNIKRPVKALADLKGLKIRVAESPLWLAIFNALGCNATPMNYGEVYTGLQQGTIDGLSTIANLFITSRFVEYTKYINELGIGGSEHTVFMNKQFYDSLPPDLQKIVDEAMRETLIWWRQASDKAHEEVYARMAKMGCQVTRRTPEFLAACIAVEKPVIEKFFRLQLGAELMNMADEEKKSGKRAF